MPLDPTIVGSVRLQVRGGTLKVVSGEADVGELSVGAEPQIVGRNPSCALVLKDKKVSAAHMEVMATERGMRVRDLGSTNGTFLGAHRVVEVVLAKPDSLRCGDAILEYEPGKPERVPLSKDDSFGQLAGATPIMRALFERLRLVAPTPLSVLIEGETGTGKEVAALAIHQASGRSDKPFVVIDCSALPSTLAESALFGHEKGAFTGSVGRRTSPFVEAHGGTVFLDELGELPLDFQPKLLRVLAEQRIKSVGSNTYVPVDVRIIAATRKSLRHEINSGGFRDDLYFRIADEHIELPPLRERREDVMLLVQRIMADAGKAQVYRRISARSIERLLNHDWPGNVRELRSLVRRALAYDRGGPIDLSLYLGSPTQKTPTNGKGSGRSTSRDFKESREEHDRNYFRDLHRETNGNLSEIARLSGASRVTVRAHLRRYGLSSKG